MDTRRKLLHEQFTSYVGEPSLPEVLAFGTILIPLLTIRHSLAALFNLKLRNLWMNLLWDTLCIVIPAILLLTLANLYIVRVWVSVSALSVLCNFISVPFNQNQPIHTQDFTIDKPKMAYMLMSLTCMMLLGIDLPICPRRFAKTHTYGFSLMDVGTGWAVFLSASSAYQYILLSSGAANTLGCLLRRIVLPAFIVGSVRIGLITLLNYQQAPEEYGSHWNFFYTFAFVRFISCMVLSAPFFTSCRSLVKRCLLLMGLTLFLFFFSSYIEQQVSVLMAQHADWPSIAARSNSLLVANAEGVLSLPGYMAIYFCGLLYFTLSRLIFDNTLSYNKIGSFLAYALFSLCVITSSYAYLDYSGWHSISRRFANSGYIVFIVMTSVFSILFTSCSGFIYYLCGGSFDSQPSVLVLCTSTFGMVYFLLSNLATGVVNLLVDTLDFLPGNSVVNPKTGVYPVGAYSTVVQLLIFLVYTLVCLTLVFVFKTKSLTVW